MEVARNRDGTGGLALPRHNCPKDRRVAIYCEGLSGAQAAGGHKADIMEAFTTTG